jgi:hypothetical protein
MVFIEGNGALTEAQHGFRTKNQMKQHYRFLSKEQRRTMEKKMNPI